jgi:hypothetical protein
MDCLRQIWSTGRKGVVFCQLCRVLLQPRSTTGEIVPGVEVSRAQRLEIR